MQGTKCSRSAAGLTIVNITTQHVHSDNGPPSATYLSGETYAEMVVPPLSVSVEKMKTPSCLSLADTVITLTQP